MTSIINQSPFLRTSREFPDEDMSQLCQEVNKSYLDVASAVNYRTIGLYPANRPAITGNQVFLTTVRQQTLRQIYTFAAAGDIPHNIRSLQPGNILSAFGSYTDDTDTYGVIYSSSVGIAGQVTFYVTSTDIVVTVDATAPVPSSGFIILEWMSAP